MTSRDKSSMYRPFLIILAGLLFCASLLILAGVLERCVAAMWMGYKFSGFSNDGYITLSIKTARMYIPIAVCMFILSYGTMILSKKKQVDFAKIMSKCAAVTYFIAIAIYLILGFSPLNQWRA